MNGNLPDPTPGKKLTIILTGGPYHSQYADLAYNIANTALDLGYTVNMFLYMDATHIPKKGQNPLSFPHVGEEYKTLLRKGADIRACIRCATARGHTCIKDPYIKGVQISSVYDIPKWVEESDKLITLG